MNRHSPLLYVVMKDYFYHKLLQPKVILFFSLHQVRDAMPLCRIPYHAHFHLFHNKYDLRIPAVHQLRLKLYDGLVQIQQLFRHQVHQKRMLEVFLLFLFALVKSYKVPTPTMVAKKITIINTGQNALWCVRNILLVVSRKISRP